MRALLAFSTLFLAALQGAPAQAAEQCDAVGLEGIQFENAPVEYNVPCNVTILKGTQRNADRAFPMPQTMVAINRDHGPAFSWRQTAGGDWELTLPIYFPRSDSDPQLSKDLSKYYATRCNQEEVTAYLNDPMNGYKKEKDKDIKLSPLPVRSIGIRLSGVNGYYDVAVDKYLDTVELEDASCGKANMLEYAGREFNAKFVMTEEQRDAFVASASTLGVHVTAQVVFNARVSQGSVYAKIDLSSVANSLEAAFSASGPVKYIGEADLRARLSKISSEIALNMQTEGDLSGNQMATKLVDQITSLLNDAAQKALAETSQKETTAAGKAEGKISLTALVEGFRKQQSIPLQYQALGANQSLKYVTTTIFQEPGMSATAYKIRASNLKDGVRVIGNLKKDMKIRIQLVQQAKQDVKINVVSKKPLSIEQVRSMGLAGQFPELANAAAQNPKSLRALGATSLWPLTTAVLERKESCWYGTCATVARTLWFDIISAPSFEPDWKYVTKAIDMNQLGLAFSFDIGGLEPLEKLVRNRRNGLGNVKVELNSESNEIILTAKEDVGAVHLHVLKDNFAETDLKDTYKSQEYSPRTIKQETFVIPGKPSISLMQHDREEPMTRAVRIPKRLVAYEFSVRGEEVETNATAASVPVYTQPKVGSSRYSGMMRDGQERGGRLEGELGIPGAGEESAPADPGHPGGFPVESGAAKAPPVAASAPAPKGGGAPTLPQGNRQEKRQVNPMFR